MRANFKVVDGLLNEIEGKPIDIGTLEKDLIFPDSGFIKNYIDIVSETTDAPKVFHLFGAYSLLSAIAGNLVYIPFGHSELNLNVWVVLIAPSSLFRKTTALTTARSYLWSNDFSKSLVLPNEFSPEAFVSGLQNNPTGTLFVSEFGGFLSMLQKDYMSSTKELLTDLYDSPKRYIRKLKNHTVEIENPAISIFGATTLNWLLDRIKENDWQGGFLTRFLFVPVTVKEKTIAWPKSPSFKQTTILNNQLKNIYEYLNNKRQVLDSKEIKKPFESWATRFEEQVAGNEQITPFAARLEIYALKLAALNALAKDIPSLVPTADDLRHAARVIEFIYQSTAKLFEEEISFNPEEKVEKKIIKVLSGNPEGLTQTELIKAVQGRNKYKWVKQIIENLEEQSQIQPEKRTVEGSKKPLIVWRLNGDSQIK